MTHNAESILIAKSTFLSLPLSLFPSLSLRPDKSPLTVCRERVRGHNCEISCLSLDLADSGKKQGKSNDEAFTRELVDKCVSSR